MSNRNSLVLLKGFVKELLTGETPVLPTPKKICHRGYPK